MRRRKEPAIFKKVLQQHATLWRELAKAQPADLSGIVRPGSVGGNKSQGDKQWTLQIDLLAWRIGRGPIQHKELTVRKHCGERLITQFMDRLKDYDIVKMRARVAPTNILGTPQAQIIRFIGKTSDAELARVVGTFKKPVRIKDPLFGVLKLDRASGDFEARAKWSGRPVRISLESSKNGTPDKALQTASQLFRSRRKWTGQAERRILSDLYTMWFDNWREEGGDPDLTRTQFLRRIRLESISTSPDGSFSLWYHDGDLFAGHSIVVDGTLKRGVKHAGIEG
jgi:hypothetical protein